MIGITHLGSNNVRAKRNGKGKIERIGVRTSGYVRPVEKYANRLPEKTAELIEGTTGPDLSSLPNILSVHSGLLLGDDDGLPRILVAINTDECVCIERGEVLATFTPEEFRPIVCRASTAEAEERTSPEEVDKARAAVFKQIDETSLDGAPASLRHAS